MKTPDEYMNLISIAYDFVARPLPFLGSTKEIAEKFYKPYRTLDVNVNRLIHWHSTMSAIGGFITGFAGVIAMPVTLPAELAVLIYLQLRMVGAIAYLYGHDIQSERVISMAGLSLCGNKATEILHEVGIKIIGKQILKGTTKIVSSQLIAAINKAVGLKLLSTFSTKGTVNLGKAVPCIGAIVGSSFNYMNTLSIGRTAKKLFKE